ncbi:MAG: hypothetical protein FJZ04_02685 [Candidatus Moranbacteria bacterium]|nr:hypothetical protein [Candidatus Moranbacteria bacterium]
MKPKKLRFLAVFVLALAFGVRFAAIGISSFLFSNSLFFVPSARALTFTADNLKDFRYTTDTLRYLAKINLKTFVGQPVKIPVGSANPDKIPGGDQDYVIVHPPRFLNAKATVPLQVGLFASGKTISPEDAQLVQNIEREINNIAENNPLMLEILKNMLERNLQMSVKDKSSLVALLLQVVRAQDSASDSTIADNPLLLSDTDLDSLGLSNLDTENPQVKQLLVIMLLLLLINQALAQSVNTEKQDCLDSGGEWINNECVNENIQLCEENGGMWKKFKNQCLADKQFCGNETLKCSATGTEEETFFGCACKAGNCLNEEGLCVDLDESNKAVCEDSSGTWQEFSSPGTLCLGRCSATETMCREGSSAQQWTMSVNQLKKSSKNCKCPEGKCLAADGSCITDESKNGDDDKDGVNNQYDRCPGTPQGEPVNTVQGSPDQGCSCNQLAAMGRIPRPYCPPDGCEGDYLVRYDRSMLQNPQQLCQNGVIQQPQQFQTLSGTGGATTSSCPVISREPNQQCADQNNKNKNDNLNKKLDDLLKQLKDQNKKPNQGGKQPNNQGGGGGGGGPTGDPGQGGPGKQEPKPDDDAAKKKAQLKGNDPEGVGKINAEQDGTANKPFILHTSQFTKVCGENTYVLTNAKPSRGNFIDKSGEKATKGPDPINLGTCSGPDCKEEYERIKGNINNELKKIKDWSKVNKSTAEELIKLVDSARNDTSTKTLLEKLKAINKLINQAEQEASTMSSAADYMKKGTDTMAIGGLLDKYFKVPSCQELASCHCCVCSCCDCQKKECGWAIQKECKEGECTKEKCTKCPEAMQTCTDEKPEKSVAITMGPVPEVEKCSKGKKKVTSMEKCEKFKEPVHQSVCRYDCEGNTKGCEEGYKDCRIVIKGETGRTTIEVDKIKKGSEEKPGGSGNKGTTIFINTEKGSLVKSNDWLNPENLNNDKKGKCCNCDPQHPKIDTDLTSGSLSGQQGSGTGTQPYQQTDPWPTDQDLRNMQKPPTVSPGTPSPAKSGIMTPEEINKLYKENPLFRDGYLKNNDKLPHPTWEDWQTYQKYNDWYDGWSGSRLVNGFLITKMIFGDYYTSFGFYRSNIK